MTFSLGSTPRSLVKYNDQSIAAITEIATSAKDSMVLIKTLTASSSGTLAFVDGADDVVLDNTYPIYVFKFINCHAGPGDVKFQFNMSIDSGSNYNVTKTTTAFVSYHREDDSDTNFDYYTSSDLAQSTSDQFLHTIADTQGNNNDDNIVGTLQIFNPSSATFVKHFIVRTIFNSNADPAYCVESHIAGYGNTTSAVDAVQFKFNSGNIDAGTIKLYGLKDS